MLVSIVIPCYNSEKTIGMVADQCMECFSQWDGYECEMILVNDHSRDQTYAAILKCQERYPGKITAVNFAKNFGQHAAILAGMIVYAISLVAFRGMTRSEIMKLPKGALIVRVFEKMGLLR